MTISSWKQHANQKEIGYHLYEIFRIGKSPKEKRYVLVTA